MLINSLKIALRHLATQKLNTSVHVIGLTLGISVCLIITLFIRYELSFDTYHKDYQRTYRINSIWIDGEKKNYTFSTPFPMADALRTGGTAYEKVVFAHPLSKVVMEVKNEKFLHERALIVSPEFLDVFSIETVSGNAASAIRKPYGVLITASAARKFFGDEEAVGKVIKYKNEFSLTVGAVIKDLPANTHLNADMLLSYVANESYLGNGFTNWGMVAGTSTFVVLKDNAGIAPLQKHLNTLAEQHINSDPNLPPNVRSAFDVQPLSDIHFAPQYSGGGPWSGAIKTDWLWIFATIGLAVLILACINFINLSTAQALTRSREVGVRKSIGAGRSQLILQFLSEAWVLAFVSSILAVTIVQIVLPRLNTLLEKQITFGLIESPGIPVGIVLGVFIVGLLAGFYPAWVIARFSPAVVLKGNMSSSAHTGHKWLRSSLIVTQFVISAGLLAAVLLISEQVNFLRTKTLGFDKENVVSVPVPFGQSRKLETLLGDIAQVKDFSFASATPTANGHWGSIMTRTNGDDPNRYNVTMIVADDRFAPMYNLQLLNGRFNAASDTNYVSRSLPEKDQIMKCVVNETLVRTLGFASNKLAVGERFWIGMNSGKAEIVGVVRDFNTTSLHEGINPVLVLSMPGVYSQVGIKIHAGSDLPSTLAVIEERWKKAYPDGVFEFNFLDQQINDFYKAEARVHRLFQIFGGLAMLISCLGLWGLASFALQQRTKEIGIRKVLGASVRSIVVLLSREFVIMVLVALCIAFPLAYHLMSNWLSNFAFHIDIGARIFIVAGLASLLIALLTVSFQVMKTALSNPTESLRSE